MAAGERAAYDDYSLIGRKIMPVVGENGDIAGEQLPVRCISRDDVHRTRFERAIEQAKIHDARRGGEFEAISLHESVVTVRTLHELVAEAGSPGRSVTNSLRNRKQLMAARIWSANHDSETVIEAERRLGQKIETPRVFVVHGFENGFRILL